MRMKNGSILLLLLLLTFICGLSLKAKENRDQPFSLSAGYGVPYGNIGVNFEINPLLPEKYQGWNQYFSFTLGLGYKQDTVLPAMGFNFYPLKRDDFFIPRLSFYYAKVDRILDKENTWEEDYDSIEALCLGAGISVRVTNCFYLRADAFYLFHIYDDIDPEEIDGRFKFALGAQLNLNTDYENQIHPGTSEKNPSYLQVGLGLGIPYGGVGVNLEFSPLLPGTIGQAVHGYSSLIIGSGFSSAGSAYSVGLRIYPLGKEYRYRPRVGVHYGTVAIFQWWGGDSSNLEGIAISAGLLVKLNDHWAVDGDFIYIADVFGWDIEDLDSAFKFSLGIRLLL